MARLVRNGKQVEVTNKRDKQTRKNWRGWEGTGKQGGGRQTRKSGRLAKHGDVRKGHKQTRYTPQKKNREMRQTLEINKNKKIGEVGKEQGERDKQTRQTNKEKRGGWQSTGTLQGAGKDTGTGKKENKKTREREGESRDTEMENETDMDKEKETRTQRKQTSTETKKKRRKNIRRG